MEATSDSYRIDSIYTIRADFFQILFTACLFFWKHLVKLLSSSIFLN